MNNRQYWQLTLNILEIMNTLGKIGVLLLLLAFALNMTACTDKSECIGIVDVKSSGTTFDLAGDEIYYFKINNKQVSKDYYNRYNLGDCYK